MLTVKLQREGRKEKYELHFPYNQELIDKIKILPPEKRSFSYADKIWEVEAVALMEIFKGFAGRKDIFFEFPSPKERTQFLNIIEKHKKAEEKKKAALQARLDRDDYILNIKEHLEDYSESVDFTPLLKDGVIPYPYQKWGAFFMAQLDSGILAMDVGCGKTISSLMSCEINEKVKKVLCVVPASLKLNWQDEVHKFTHQKAYVIKVTKNKLTKYRRNNGVKLEDAKYVILNYDYFNRGEFDVQKKIIDIGLGDIDTIIYDEAHKLGYKGNNTVNNMKRSIQQIADRQILLTGTPIRSKMQQLFPLLKLVKGDEFSNEGKFYKEYCGLKFDTDFKKWVPDENNPPRLEALNERLNTLMYRVRKEDVLKDLPDIIKNKVFIEMTPSERKDYEAIREGRKAYDIEHDKLIDLPKDEESLPIVIIGRLRQFTASLKTKAVYNLIKELNDADEKVVVFDNFKRPLFELHGLLGARTKLYTGDQNVDERQALVDEFQSNNSSVDNLLITTQAGNAGITLTKSANLIQITQSYIPAENEQAYGRIHRISQLRGVNVFICLVADTLDELIYDQVEEKQKMITKVIDNIDYVADIEETIFAELVKAIKKKGYSDED